MPSKKSGLKVNWPSQHDHSFWLGRKTSNQKNPTINHLDHWNFLSGEPYGMYFFDQIPAGPYDWGVLYEWIKNQFIQQDKDQNTWVELFGLQKKYKSTIVALIITQDALT